jgi:hypothetical protein
VTFDLSATKKIKCSLAGAYNGQIGGESVTCTGSNTKLIPVAITEGFTTQNQ